jgi:hypothetical protein
MDLLADGAVSRVTVQRSDFRRCCSAMGRAGEQPGERVTRLVGRHELRGDERALRWQPPALPALGFATAERNTFD